MPGGGAEPGCLRPAAAGPGSGCPRSARGGGGGGDGTDGGGRGGDRPGGRVAALVTGDVVVAAGDAGQDLGPAELLWGGQPRRAAAR